MNDLSLLGAYFSQEKPITTQRFLKMIRHAKRAGGAGRTARLRKKKMKAACQLWFGRDTKSVQLINRIFHYATRSNRELAS